MLLCLLAATLPLGEKAMADMRIDVGLLTCGTAGVRSKARGADRESEQDDLELLCTFIPATAKPEETYTGALDFVGPSRGLSSGRAMIWIVKAPADFAITAGTLEQVYAADNLLPLPNAPPLTGQTNAAIVLQDITDARQLGDAAVKNDRVGPIIILMSLKLRSARS